VVIISCVGTSCTGSLAESFCFLLRSTLLHIALSQKQSRFKFNMGGLSWGVFADEISVDKFQCFNLEALRLIYHSITL
jgi:hypothetical protein